MITVRVRYFSTVRLKAKVAEDQFSLQDGAIIEDLLNLLHEKYGPEFMSLIRTKDGNFSVVIWLNGEYVGPEATLTDGGTVALICALSGG